MSPQPSGRVAARPSMAAAILAFSALFVAVRFGAFVAGGSDSYCYLAQARSWTEGTILQPAAPGFEATWDNGALSLVPTGFVPSRVVPGGIAPICPPGLGVLMAAATLAAGPWGAYAIVPLSGALLVWAAWLLASRLAGPVAGLAAAVVTLTSPIFLHQLVQPMSDVPAAALWVLALVSCARATPRALLLGGALAGLGMFIRPNLAPLALPLAGLAWHAPGARWPARLWRVLQVASGAIPGACAVLWVHTLVYGSPFGTGYGSPALLFAWANVAPNILQYARWLVETQSPFPLMGWFAPVVAAGAAPGHEVLPDRIPGRAVAVSALAMVAVTVLLYLPYVVFDAWSYLRFLLPAVAILGILASATLVWVALRWPTLVRNSAIALVVVATALHSIKVARERHVFDLRDSEAQFVETGEWVRRHLPADAVVITVWHSGSLRLYGERFTVLWDAIVPRQLDHVLAELSRQGRRPYLLFASWEIPAFRERFATTSPTGALDWPPKAQVGRDVSIFDPADRARYFSGGSVATERVWTAAERRRFGVR